MSGAPMAAQPPSRLSLSPLYPLSATAKEGEEFHWACGQLCPGLNLAAASAPLFLPQPNALTCHIAESQLRSARP